MSKIQTCGLDFGHRDLVLLDLLIKRASRNTETLGGLLNATFLLMQHSLDVLLFEFYQCEPSIQKRCAELCVSIEVKIVKGDVCVFTQQHGTFDNVTQFANVAGPGVRLKRLDATLVQAQFATAQIGRDLVE